MERCNIPSEGRPCGRPLGKIHSFQSLGAVDGPGIRYVVFMQGCPYRCPWCHNPDTQDTAGGESYTAEELVARIRRYKTYFTGGGGVTLSGGEPLLQQDFALDLFTRLHREGISTALDTAGRRPNEATRALLAETDTVLCDLKFCTDEDYRRHIGISLHDVLAFLSLCEEMGKDVVIRHVVVPGMTDDPEHVRRIAELARSVVSHPRIELLPFRKLCVEKYERLGIPFPVAHLPECSAETIERLTDMIAQK